MSPQPKRDEKDTAAELALDRKTAEPPEDKPTFEVGRLRVDGEAILGYALPDVRAAFAGVPDSREVGVTDAKARVRDWLKAPVETHETPAAEQPV